MEQPAGGMLRQLDTRRKILRLPSPAKRTHRYLGLTRKPRPFPERQSKAVAIDHRALEFCGSTPQPRWEEDSCDRGTAARRIGAARREIGPVCALPFRNFGRGCELLQGPAMGYLLLFSRGNPLEEQGGWEREIPAHFPTHDRRRASLVSGWKVDCVYGPNAREAVQDLPNCGGR